MNNSGEFVVKIVDLKGSYYQFGLEQSKEVMSSPLKEKLGFLSELTTNSNFQKAKEVLQNLSPNLFQELEGLAEGIDLPLDTIIQLYSGYDVTFPQMGCTTLVNDGYYVRNYDFSDRLYDARLVFSNPTNGYCCVGFSQSLIGRLDGMNEKGLVVGLHFVNSEHKQEGFIATTIVRVLLEQCATIEEAGNLIKNIPHGYCYNYSMTDTSGKSVKVEASPQQQVVNFTNPLICTNHFESERLRDKNQIEVIGSVKRKEYISTLLGGDLTTISAYHHFNNENSPLFFNNYKEYFGTLHTVVYSPKDLSIIIGVGGNCQPVKFSLKEYMEGTVSLPENIKGTINQSI